MKAFVAWVLGRRHWLAFLAIVFVQFLPPVACALLIVDGARHGPTRAGPIAAVVLAVVALAAFGPAGVSGLSLASGVVTVLAGYLLGYLLHRTNSLELAFQATMLAALSVAALFALLGPSPSELVGPIIEQLAGFMAQMGGTSEQINNIRNWDPVLLLGTLYAGVVAQIMSALILASWAWGKAEDSFHFARQFTALRLGRVVGILAIVALTASLVLPWSALQYMRSASVVGFLLQGLAVAHAWMQAKAAHWSVPLIMYTGAVVQIYLVISGLCAIGLLDNFFSLRRPLRSGAA